MKGRRQTCWLKRRDSRGTSLLEVILAIAVFGLALAMLGELMRMGVRSAERARDESQAQLLCQSVFAELRAGAIPAQSIGQAPFPDDPDWTYSIDVLPAMQEGLLEARVRVERFEEDAAREPLFFELVGLMVDPALEEMMAEPIDGALPGGSSSGSLGLGASGGPANAFP